MSSSLKRVLFQGVLVLAVTGLGGCGVTDEGGASPQPLASEERDLTSACCIALPGTPQSFCDSVPQTRDRCNQVNGGTSCQWKCSCCVAKPGTPQSFCDGLPQTPDRCNQANGGTSCTWSC
jgi:hypothetical protein